MSNNPFDHPEELFHLSVKALIRDSEGKVLVLEANPKHTSVKHWDLPGGRLHKGMDLETTLRRELEEEIGLKAVKIIELLDCSISNHRVNFEPNSVGIVLFTFICEIPENEKIELTDEEHISFDWVSSQKASELLSHKFSTSLTEKLKNL